jgi:hypothetical protein
VLGTIFSLCPFKVARVFGWSLELLIQRMEMDPLPKGHQKTLIREVEERDPNRFESVLKPLVEGGQKSRIRDALRPSRIEGEQELKQIVAGATRDNKSIVDLFQRNFALDELDASALAGVVLPCGGSVTGGYGLLLYGSKCALRCGSLACTAGPAARMGAARVSATEIFRNTWNLFRRGAVNLLSQ